MINRFFFLFSASIFLFGNISRSIASSSFPTYTQHTPMEPEPASLLDLDHAYKTASVCFLGKNGCGDDGKFNKGDSDYSRNPEDMCKEEGYTKTSCTIPYYLYSRCPYDGRYYKECRKDNARACKDSGYSTSCGTGYIPDTSQVCPYDSSYKKCKCNPCSGYDYTYAQANAEGYQAGASCNSCGTMKYQRQNAACSGFLSCECGGQIGAASCKSGTNTLFKSCNECIKCDDTCPSGYYKDAGDNGRCNFGSNTKTTECGTTCYQCKAPKSGGFCWQNDCREGYTFSDETHDYSCNELTCRNKIKAKYPSYFYGYNTAFCSDYKFERTYIGEGGGNTYYTGNWCYLARDEITQSFYTESDFFSEFPQCQQYCPPTGKINNKTFKGNIYLGISSPSDSAFTGIIVDGTLTLPGTANKYFTGLTLTPNSTLMLYTRDLTNTGALSPAKLKNVTLYQGAKIESSDYLSYLYDATISANTAATPVILKNITLNGTLTSAHILSGSSGGIYLDLYFSGSNMEMGIINRKPGGRINVTLEDVGYDKKTTLFKNPGIDTVVTINKKRSIYASSQCVFLANDSSRKICSSYKGNTVITFLTDDYSKHVLPTCCSQDSGCAASSWNNGKVKCEGYSQQ